VTAVDARTLRVQLDKPLPWFSNLTANFAFYPVQKANVESGKEWTRPGALVGNGAYVLNDRVVNEKLVVVPNTHYWDNAKTVLQKVTFIPINQESSATKRYLAGDIDITESFPKNMYQKLLKDIPGRLYAASAGHLLLSRLTRKRADGRCPRSSGAEHDHRSPHYGGKGVRHGREAGLAFHP
jgi:oligopeptide transport system substrate-binding protein